MILFCISNFIHFTFQLMFSFSDGLPRIEHMIYIIYDIWWLNFVYFINSYCNKLSLSVLVFLISNTPRLVLNLTEVIIYNGCILYFHICYLYFLFCVSYLVFQFLYLSCHLEHFLSGSQADSSVITYNGSNFSSTIHVTATMSHQQFYKKIFHSSEQKNLSKRS